MFKNKKDSWAIILIVIVTFIVYFNTLGNPFVFDDFHMITKNSYIKSHKYLFKFFISPEITSVPIPAGMYRPLLMWTFVFNYAFGRLNPLGYHIINIMFHFLNAILLFFILKYLICYKNPKNNYWYETALITTVLFVVHPVNTEAVNYISCRSTLMASFFFLFGFFLYLKKDEYIGFKHWWSYLGSLVCFILGLFTKEIMIMFPLMVLMYDLFYKREKFLYRDKKLIYYISFFIIGILYLFWRRHLFGAFGTIKYLRTPYSNILTQAKVSIFYLRLFFWPVDLCIGRYIQVAKSIFQPSIFFAVVSLVLILVFALVLHRKYPLICLAVFWYFINLTPKFIGSLALLAAEHHLYLPSIGIYFLISRILKFMLTLKNKKMLYGLIAIILIVFSSLTVRRNKVWHSRYSLWRSSLEVSPQPIGTYNNLALACIGLGRYDEAIYYIKKGLSLDVEEKRKWRLMTNLGNIYFKKGLLKEAEAQYLKVKSLGLESEELYNNLGMLYEKQRRFSQAITEFKKAIELNPNMVEAYHNLGIVYWRKKDFKLAIEKFQKAIEKNPDFIRAYIALIMVYKEIKDLDKALVICKKALEISPSNPFLHYNLGILYGKKADKKAIEEFKKAISLAPRFAEAHYNLAVSYAYLSPPKIALAKKHLKLAIQYGYQPDPRFLSYLKTLENH